MNRYFSQDTDTLVFRFSDERVADLIDLDYQTLLELDCNGNPVMLTIEHARERGLIGGASSERVPIDLADPVLAVD